MIDLENVLFRWHADRDPTLDIETFSVAAGERVFLHGPSGSGKTTLLNLVGGVTRPERGTVRIDETDIAALSGSARDSLRARSIGFVFQQFNLLPYLPLIENVTLPCRFSETRRRHAVEKDGSPEAAARRLLTQMRLDTDTLSHRPVAELSVGQQQRVAAARALIGSPRLVIADEPTSSVDAANRTAFLELLFAEVTATGATLLFVSHDADLAPGFDRSVSLADINRATQ